jgi:hypothetical protein
VPSANRESEVTINSEPKLLSREDSSDHRIVRA